MKLGKLIKIATEVLPVVLPAIGQAAHAYKEVKRVTKKHTDQVDSTPVSTSVPTPPVTTLGNASLPVQRLPE